MDGQNMPGKEKTFRWNSIAVEKLKHGQDDKNNASEERRIVRGGISTP